MIYWQYILIFAVFFYAGWNLFRLLRRIRRDHFQKMAVRKLLKRSRIERGRMYFNSDVLRRTIAFLLGCRSQSARRALLNMACGKTAPAEAFLRRRGHETDALLLETLSAAEPDKRLSPVETAVFRLFAGDKDAAEKIIENVPDSDLSRYAKARKRFVQGWLFLRDGDMLSASACAAEAVSLFEREKAFVEEAQALLLSGTVSRLSCVEDVAEFMFDAAAGLFRSYGDAVGEAEAVGNCGMLWTLQEKFAEAADDFAQALKLSLTAGAERLAAGLLNQQALLNILQRRYTEARRCLEQSEKISRRLNSVSGLAFSAELSAHVFYARKKRDKAAAAAAKAAGYYRRDGNLAACFESLYLQALALFENGETGAAEQVLRAFLPEAKKQRTSFHIAGAYNLMGLIFLRRREETAAKVWFQEAAALERKNDRYTAAAADYANIGLIELHQGNAEQARKNLQTAVACAETFGKNGFSRMLNEKLQKLN